MNCDICPRNCNINREKNCGFCGQSKNLRISKVMFHHYEEPIISGEEKDKGSGAIFFTGCNLRCVFCQNYPISHKNKGRNISAKKLVKIFKMFERKGALNINLVTPSHFTDQIVEVLKIYKPKIPIVWNSNGYETERAIEKLKGLVDIFLVDMKYLNDEIAMKYSSANNYVEHCTKAIKKMKEIVSRDEIVDGKMKSGIIVRHLILPTHTDESIKCLNWICDNIGKDTIVSLMSQYEPRYDAKKYVEINRKITPLEYKRVVAHALKKDMNNCFIQDLSSADSKYTPRF